MACFAAQLAFNMDRNIDNVDEVFIANAAGGDEPIRISGAFAAGEEAFNVQWSATGERVAFFADPNVADQFELFTADPDLADSAVPASGTLDVNEDVFQFAWSPDGTRLVIVADLETEGVSEVLVTSATGGSAPVKVSGVMTAAAARTGLSSGGHRWRIRSDANCRRLLPQERDVDEGADVSRLNWSTAERGLRGRSGTTASAAGRPTGISRYGFSFGGRLRISRKKFIGLGVCVRVASPAR